MTKKDQSAPSDATSLFGCGRTAVAGDERDRSADAILKHLMEFINKEYLHARRQKQRAENGEMFTSPKFYDGRSTGMTIIWDELQKLRREHEHSVTEGQ